MTDTYFGVLDRTNCPECGVIFGIPEELMKKLREKGTTFYCPNGHKLHFGDSENDRLRRERDRLKQQMAEKDDAIERRDRWLEDQRKDIEHEKRRHAATKGNLTKAKKRANAGVCPHCTRTFANMATHIRHMHPEKIHEPEAEAPVSA